MTNIVDVTYQQTGQSKSTNEFGMREMQAKAYESRDSECEKVDIEEKG